MENNKIIPGPIQEAWLKELENHPERQGKIVLGKKDANGNEKLCCLGQYEVTRCKKQSILPEWKDTNNNGTLYLLSGGSKCSLLTNKSFYSSSGTFKVPATINGYIYRALTIMNDGTTYSPIIPALTWPEIAAYVRANPDNVFKESM